MTAYPLLDGSRVVMQSRAGIEKLQYVQKGGHRLPYIERLHHYFVHCGVKGTDDKCVICGDGDARRVRPCGHRLCMSGKCARTFTDLQKAEGVEQCPACFMSIMLTVQHLDSTGAAYYSPSKK